MHWQFFSWPFQPGWSRLSSLHSLTVVALVALERLVRRKHAASAAADILTEACLPLNHCNCVHVHNYATVCLHMHGRTNNCLLTLTLHLSLSQICSIVNTNEKRKRYHCPDLDLVSSHINTQMAFLVNGRLMCKLYMQNRKKQRKRLLTHCTPHATLLDIT